MKIYMMGPHSSGKSTLSKYVSDQYKMPMIPETARMILSEQELQIDSLRCNLDVVDKYQQQVFDRQISEEKKYNDNFVSDRSAIDILAYSAQHSRISSYLLPSPVLEDYINKLKSPDVFIFFVRPSKATLKADGVRESINWDGIVAIDAMVKMLLEMFNLRYFQIDTSNMQERVRFINSVLSLS